MDPDTNLEEMRQIAKSLLNDKDESISDLIDKSNRLAELVIAQDKWISNGGFLPKKWNKTNAV